MNLLFQNFQIENVQFKWYSMISKNTDNNLQFVILSPNDDAQIFKGSEGFGSEWCKMLSN